MSGTLGAWTGDWSELANRLVREYTDEEAVGLSERDQQRVIDLASEHISTALVSAEAELRGDLLGYVSFYTNQVQENALAV